MPNSKNKDFWDTLKNIPIPSKFLNVYDFRQKVVHLSTNQSSVFLARRAVIYIVLPVDD